MRGALGLFGTQLRHKSPVLKGKPFLNPCQFPTPRTFPTLQVLNSERLKQGARAGENFHFSAPVGVLHGRGHRGSAERGVRVGADTEGHCPGMSACGGQFRQRPPQRRVLPGPGGSAGSRQLAPTPGDKELPDAGGRFWLPRRGDSTRQGSLTWPGEAPGLSGS